MVNTKKEELSDVITKALAEAAENIKNNVEVKYSRGLGSQEDLIYEQFYLYCDKLYPLFIEEALLGWENTSQDI